jgi:methionyl-tRNA formyltransferase
MRTILLANNRLGRDAAAWIADTFGPPVALVVHPAARARCRDALVDASRVDGAGVFDAERLREAETLARLAALEPQIGLSVLFGYLLRREFLDLLPSGCVNLHPAFLPYNRGAHPNVWGIVEGTPAGVTLHYVDEGVDTGDIVAQRPVEVESSDTGITLYRKLEAAALHLLREQWPLLREGRAARRPQPPGGTWHRVADVTALDRIDLDRQYTGRELINILRARTFPPYRNAFFEENGRRVYLQLELSAEAAVPGGQPAPARGEDS